MNIKAIEKAGRCDISISDDMTIYNAASLKDELLGHLSRYQQLEISLKEVTELDSSGVQIMLMLNREAESKGKQLSFKEHSPAVIDVIDMLNLAGHFGDPIVVVSGEQSV